MRSAKWLETRFLKDSDMSWDKTGVSFGHTAATPCVAEHVSTQHSLNPNYGPNLTKIVEDVHWLVQNREATMDNMTYSIAVHRTLHFNCFKTSWSSHRYIFDIYDSASKDVQIRAATND